MAKKSKTPRAASQFPVGSRVRVKTGTTVPDFEDIPLGGWAGTVTEVDQRAPTTYLIEWDRHTMEQMHPAYRSRCEREGLDLESMWLGEDDLLPDDGSPPAIERPTAIRTRPLDMEDQDDRVRAILGLTADDPLPGVGERTLHQYHRHLAKHLSFPFAATFTRESGFLRSRSEAVTVVALADAAEIDETYGLFCEALKDRQRLVLPLGEVEAREGDPNRRLVADYCYWFWNWR